MKQRDAKELFDELRYARSAAPLLNETEIVEALHRTVATAPTPRNYSVVVGTGLGLVAAAVIGMWFIMPQADVPTLPPPIPLPNVASSMVQNELPNNTTSIPTEPRHVVAPSSIHKNVAPSLPSSKVIKASSARIAGLPFLDLTATEFAALPDGLQPEIRTQRSSTALASGRLRERRTMECLTHAANASSVVDNGEEYVQMSAMYIPVRRVEQKANGKVETVEWFKPTGDLISLLPERYRVPIMLELNLLSEVQRGCITPSEACRSLPHAQSYFDMCRLDASRIKDITLNPNPARNVASCAIDLRYSATVHLAAYTTSGAYVAELAEAVTLDPGVHEFTIPLNGLAPGMYLITATTQDGEHVVRRLIIE